MRRPLDGIVHIAFQGSWMALFLVSTSLLPALLGSAAARAGEVGFIEDFALARDRDEALKQLIPGTEDDFFYRCLQFQNTGRLAEADQLLKPWIEKHGRTARVVEMENRQALLRYAAEPRRTLDFLRERLGLKFDHRPESPEENPELPAALDAALISRQALARRALELHPGTLDGFADRALEWALELQLDPERRRQALNRLQYPGIPGLPKLVADDLAYKNSGGFGSLKIHGLLLLEELEDCLKLRPGLLAEEKFILAWIVRLRPRSGEDWRTGAAARQAYLERLWAFVSRLGPAQNSLKAHVLYHRLVHDRSLGIYDKARFLEYLRLPRSAPYVRAAYLQRDDQRRHLASLAADYRETTQLPPIASDEPLVRSFLEKFFQTEDDYSPYAELIDDAYLKRVLAETRILAAGADREAGSMERWYALLPPAALQELKDRVDIDFAFTSKTVFGSDEPVGIDVHLKNVRTLIVKVFEVNLLNFYRDAQRELDAAIDLDGLVASEESTYEIPEPPLHRITRHFDFPALDKRGAFVIELIGGGRSSRALFRKGRIKYLERIGAAGHVFTVLDESNRKLSGASIWMGGVEYRSAGDGRITVPFSNAPAQQPIILLHEGFASLDRFSHQSENYRLSAGIHIEREALLSLRKATVIIRPSLYLNERPVTLSVLEEPALRITSADRDGVRTTREIKSFQLFEDRESALSFQVPANLASIEITLAAGVRSMSQGKRLELQDGREFKVNGIEATERIEDVQLGRSDAGYFLEVFGKSGEARPDRPAQVRFIHEDFRDPVDVQLRADASGRVALGELPGIASLSAQSRGGENHSWTLPEDRHSYPDSMHGRAGARFRLPYMGSSRELLRSEAALFEVRGDRWAADRFGAASIRGGSIELEGLPAGDYDFIFKKRGNRIRIRLEDGPEAEGHVLAAYRQLEVKASAPLQIASIRSDADAVRIQLEGATEFTRVHVAATRYLPDDPIFESLDSVIFPEPGVIVSPPPESVYVAGRDIGDEYRYVLERKLARKLPGNMLARPSLLLNPWPVRSTETGQQDAKAGEAAEAGAGGAVGERLSRRGMKREGGVEGEGTGSGLTSFEFLPEPAPVLFNLRPDAGGVVVVPRQDLRDRSWIHVVAVSPEEIAGRHAAIAGKPLEPRDLRLASGLDPSRHFTERKEVSILHPQDQLALEDLVSSQMEVYDSLARVFGLFRTLSGSATLAEFDFILRWPGLKAEEKRAKYSQHACHELNFFLHEKDAAFFAETVRPFIASKLQKTFIDRWLLEEDLSEYLKSWAYQRLNIVERILLARRIPGEAARAARHVKDLSDLSPADPQRLEALFQTALRGRALEQDAGLGIAAAERAKAATGEADFAAPELSLKGAPPAPAESPPVPSRPAKTLELKKNAPAAAAPAPKQEMKEKAGKDSAARRFFDADGEARKELRQLYRKIEKTREWAENQYHHVPIESQNADLITASPFWADFAAHDGRKPFLSSHVAEAARSFSEMMFALAVLGLPFEAGEHRSELDKARLILRPASPLIVYHKQIREALPGAGNTPILVTQNLYRHGDRYIEEGEERRDKFLTGELAAQIVYGCQVVVTNPTSSTQKLDILLQIPSGAIPVASAKPTRSLHVDLEPYRTWTQDYLFYFPRAGSFAHYPAQVTRGDRLLASAEPRTLAVAAKPAAADLTSWDTLSQLGTGEQVLARLREANLGRIRLDRIAWRMRDKGFFEKTIALLDERRAYDPTLWSYALFHNAPAPAREYLKGQDELVARCGAALESPLLEIDPVERRSYEHLEYWPLVNARAHRLGKSRQILNNRFFDQYIRFLNILCYRPALDAGDLLGISTYLVLQDRIEEAGAFFGRVPADGAVARLQRDYLDAYLSFSTENLGRARSRAQEYASYPVDRWRDMFRDAISQLDEIEGKPAPDAAPDARGPSDAKLASTEPALELEVEGDKVMLRSQNLAECRLSYYLMDLELLFSRNPFVGEYSGQFGFIQPNASEAVRLDPKGAALAVPLPERFRASNLLIEASGAGLKKARTRFSGAMAVQVIEARAQLRVSEAAGAKSIPAAYVKVYARRNDGSVRFYKDGYTDLRGRFDYGSLSTDELDGVNRFAILIISPRQGAIVREAVPPKR